MSYTHMSVTTLNEFIFDRQQNFEYATGELSRLISDIGLAAKIINKQVNKAGLANILGEVGAENIQGEMQQKLDVFSNNHFINVFRFGGEVCSIVSEENGQVHIFDNSRSKQGKYVVAFDPLDGSSNIDVNVPVGSIFSIWRRKSELGSLSTEEDLLQVGRDIVAAGYVIYGSSTMLVYSIHGEVNGFTLDPSIGEFCLSHPNIRIPEDGTIYSVNEAYYKDFCGGIQDYIDFCKNLDGSNDKVYSARYIGSMVSDVHRNLLKGGVFIYPATAAYPNGKLRLLYECSPMAFIIENAGGSSSYRGVHTLDIQPTSIHQRAPIILGSKNMVAKVEEFIHNSGE
eukprot:TRINITY_DN6819_c0_g1_i1.p1 TRINITY_DN6819_c0_g1~~TRINITY_DN6819_c0_g1_i1.p1  ORF type:complete len:341 (-),score=49.78 TRINITY_DN6819_c0_g1_i1:67-1089(-)